jgi:hypothetical protein
MYVPLPDDQTRRALIDYATQQDRDPRVQAARFVREGLIREGALPAEQKIAPAPVSEVRE